ncbi:MAG: hypothetical protein FWD68_18260 [Alphaproteobacteria bacterium]|nr:hypothetical protein [Alphaproteobacteria bacterium]
MTKVQPRAVGILAAALSALYEEAAGLLPRMATARQTGAAFPTRDPAHLAGVVSALTFRDRDGLTKFLTLAHIDKVDAQNLVVNYHEQETLVRLALDAGTCSTIEGAEIPGLTHAPLQASPRTGNPLLPPDAALLDHYRTILLRCTQNIALRATYLTHYLRFTIEYMALCPPKTLFIPFDHTILQRHATNWQCDVARLSPSFSDRRAAERILATSPWRWPPLIIASICDPDCETLNGIPMSRAHTNPCIILMTLSCGVLTILMPEKCADGIWPHL